MKSLNKYPENSYWNKNGLFQTDYDKYFDLLVPRSGNCATIEGELLRAANRLYYDGYNNGFCNNTSGAVNLLKQYKHLFSTDITPELNVIYSISNTNGYSDNGYIELETVMNVVFEYIISKKCVFQENIENVDLFDFQEDDYYEREEDEDDDYTDEDLKD